MEKRKVRDTGLPSIFPREKDNTFSEEMFLNIQSKSPLEQPDTLSSFSVSCYLEEETGTHLAASSFQEVVERDNFSPEPIFSRLNNPGSISTCATDPLPVSMFFDGRALPLNAFVVVRSPSWR